MPQRATSTSYGASDGNDPRSPKKYKGGRPTDTFVGRMRTLADRGAKAARWERLLDDKNKDDALFFKAFDDVADRGYGKATQPIAGDKDAPLTITILRKKT